MAKKLENQIREDLYNSLVEKQESLLSNDPYELLGNPEKVANEFIENLGLEKKITGMNYRFYGYEYVSKKKVLGLPLVHVNYKGFGVAKGITAIGKLSIGVISVEVYQLVLYQLEV